MAELIQIQGQEQEEAMGAESRNVTLKTQAVHVDRLFIACEQSYTAASSEMDLADQHGRFRVWCRNVGILAHGHASIDWLLQEADTLRSNIAKLLRDLEEELKNIHDVLSGKRPAIEDDLSAEEKAFCEDENIGVINELELRHQSITSNLRVLFRLGHTLCNQSSRHNHLSKARRLDPLEAGLDFSKPVSLTELASLLPEKLRTDASALNRDKKLVTLLAEAITTRRRQFAFWHSNARKWADPVIEYTTSWPDGYVMPPETRLITTGSTQVPSTKRIDARVASATEPNVSYASSVRDIIAETVSLPDPKERGGEDEVFECPYCFVICKSEEQDARRWRKHILEDLQPYMCTYTDCPTATSLYGSRSEWISHEVAAHRTQWTCREHPGQNYQSGSAYHSHLERDHGLLTDEQVETLLQFGAVASAETRTQCHICLQRITDPQTFVRHVAHHYEVFAAFAVPRNALVQDGALQAGNTAAVSIQEEDTAPENVESLPGRDTDEHAARSSAIGQQDFSVRQRTQDEPAVLNMFEVLLRMIREEAISEEEEAYFQNLEEDEYWRVHDKPDESWVDQWIDPGDVTEMNQVPERIRLRQDRVSPESLTQFHIPYFEAGSKDIHGRTMLSWAAEQVQEALFRLLVEHDDFKADSKDSSGRTPLSRAAEEGDESMVRLLVERDDVKADSKDNHGQTPLSWAARGGHEAVVRLLVERDDVDLKDKYGRTYLRKIDATMPLMHTRRL